MDMLEQIQNLLQNGIAVDSSLVVRRVVHCLEHSPSFNLGFHVGWLEAIESMRRAVASGHGEEILTLLASEKAGVFPAQVLLPDGKTSTIKGGNNGQEKETEK